jgi:hypothetical protein
MRRHDSRRYHVCALAIKQFGEHGPVLAEQATHHIRGKLVVLIGAEA